MFSLGKKAIQITDKIGRTTINAIKSAPSDQKLGNDARFGGAEISIGLILRLVPEIGLTVQKSAFSATSKQFIE